MADITGTRIAFGTDMGFFGPTALSLVSAIKSTPDLQQIVILSLDLTSDAADLLREIANEGEIDIHFHQLTDSHFGSVPETVRHLSKTTLARLLLPSLVQGRIIYIDGDTLVKRNLSDLFNIDLEGNLVGGVRDFGVVKRLDQLAHGHTWDHKTEREEIMAPYAAADYVNAGVLLMDCAAIRSNPEMHEKLGDFDRAARYRSLDQDHLNHVFRGKIKHLNPAWNDSWGRAAVQRARTEQVFGASDETRHEKTGIYHYHGPVKPWHRVGYKKARRHPSAIASYKVSKWLFDRRFPHIAFH
ncbi:glycosyltransferase family 8 protein [Falsirhodobacter sp. 1013]|uniref:glycosyltransferase family 8 protein n=1 Tax=Falsirhodobacter sp. 1013 TaxID=3417566 RepID=UPI003EBDBE4F